MGTKLGNTIGPQKEQLVTQMKECATIAETQFILKTAKPITHVKKAAAMTVALIAFPNFDSPDNLNIIKMLKLIALLLASVTAQTDSSCWS